MIFGCISKIFNIPRFDFSLLFSRDRFQSFFTFSPFHLIFPVSHFPRRKRPNFTNLIKYSLTLLFHAVILKVSSRNISLSYRKEKLIPSSLRSPIFTLLSNQLFKPFSCDPTGILFACIAVTFTLSGSVGIAWIMDQFMVEAKTSECEIYAEREVVNAIVIIFYFIYPA